MKIVRCARDTWCDNGITWGIIIIWKDIPNMYFLCVYKKWGLAYAYVYRHYTMFHLRKYFACMDWGGGGGGRPPCRPYLLLVQTSPCIQLISKTIIN